MTARMNLQRVAPEAYTAVLGLEKYARAHIDPTLLELVKLRASYLNRCAYCIDMHSREAMAAGEPAGRLFALAAWREAECFTARERAAIALTDEVTHLGPDGVSDEAWDGAAKEFTERELADLLIAIATINVWNRIAVPTRAVPGT
jgi:AhpD family alkylhydroperoxidase